MDIGVKEIAIIAVVMVVLFGSSRIPEFAKNIVEAMRNVRNAFSGKETVAVSKRR